MNPCSGCASVVYWQRVDFRPLLSIYKKIEWISTENVIVPTHLQEVGIRQFHLRIYFHNHCDRDYLIHALTISNIEWDAIDYQKNICFGGSVFKRKSKKGYWTLKAPCLDCYGELTREQDNEMLQKACILSYL